MSDEGFEIKIEDKVDSAIADKIKKIGDNATKTEVAIAKVATASEKLAQEQNKTSISSERLIQAQNRTSVSANQLAVSSDKASLSHLRGREFLLED